MTPSRSQRAIALERWAEDVAGRSLVEADTAALRSITELAERRSRLDEELVDAVRAARAAGRSWSEIGISLGVSKQAAQQKYGATVAT